MFRVPAYFPDASLKLVSVLEDIGVNERMVSRRRRTFLLTECMTTITDRLAGQDFFVYYFGSQVEGTTTKGLDSDTDILYSLNECNLIQDWRDWEYGRFNVMMIQDENTPPGYCLLQQLYNEEQRPVNEIRDERYARYRGDKVVIKNSFFESLQKGKKNGPADSFKEEGTCDFDYIIALPCKKLPVTVRFWLNQQLIRGMISYEMKRYIELHPCFVVPVGFKGSQYEIAEWRISTSHAERCVMFNMNITQIHCYVMMKLILKTYLKHPEETSLSSFMCKNVLLLCIEKTLPAVWCPQNFLKVFTFCLVQLRKCVEREYCPHFIVHQNTLMAGKFTPHVKYWLLSRLQTVISSNGLVFLGAEIDNFGLRFISKLNILNRITVPLKTSVEMARIISGDLSYNILLHISNEVAFISRKGITVELLRSLFTVYQQGSELERQMCRLMTPFLCTTFGSMMASVNIATNNTVSPTALTWLETGFRSDLTSSKLKVASILYSVGDCISAEVLLRFIESQYDRTIVEAVCACCPHRFSVEQRFLEFSDNNDNQTLKQIGAFCVKFLPSEIHCVPQELRYEMFRSTANDLQYRTRFDDWMDCAVVDSIPYIYFLQYMTYGRLQRRNEQLRALINLIISIITTRNLGHKETAMNLLGQCMEQEQENRLIDAFSCYTISLNIRPRNNAANFHVCRLLYQCVHA